MKRLAGLALAILIGTAGCGDSELPTGADAPKRSPSTSEQSVEVVPHSPPPVEPRVSGRLDRYFLEKARQHPGFAGAYVDAGRLIVRTKSGDIPSGLDLGRSEPMVGVSADYSFLELARWYAVFTQAVAPLAGWIDIDERENRLAAGVRDLERARHVLSQAGIPADVYSLEEAGELVAVNHTIRDSFRPLPGGVEIGVDPDGDGDDALCTLGFAVQHWLYGETVVTASHCTGGIGENVGLDVRQPWEAGKIGIEVYDEPTFTGSPCPAGYECRYSDAALIGLDSGVDYELGRIARTTGEGDILVDHSDSRYSIFDEDLILVSGDRINYMGRTSGYQTGEIESTCRDYNPSDFPNLFLLCQYETGNPPQPGDSGGPVFRPEPQGSSQVVLLGVMWLRDKGIDPDGVFSPISQIRDELNPDSNEFCEGIETEEGGGCGDEGGGGGGGGGGCASPPCPEPEGSTGL